MCIFITVQFTRPRYSGPVHQINPSFQCPETTVHFLIKKPLILRQTILSICKVMSNEKDWIKSYEGAVDIIQGYNCESDMRHSISFIYRVQQHVRFTMVLLKA